MSGSGAIAQPFLAARRGVSDRREVLGVHLQLAYHEGRGVALVSTYIVPRRKKKREILKELYDERARGEFFNL